MRRDPRRIPPRRCSTSAADSQGCARGSKAAASPIVTNSGGPSILAADRAEEAGLHVAEPGPAIRAKLAAFLPPHAALKNPIDLTVEGTERGYREALTALLGPTPDKIPDTEYPKSHPPHDAGPFDAVVAIDIAPPYLDSIPLARGICDAAAATGQPIVACFLPEAVTADAIAYLQAHGVLNFPTPERAVAVVARMAGYESANQRIGESANRRIGESANQRISESANPRDHSPFAHSPFVLEPEAMAWLRENGIPTPPFRFAATADDAAAGCAAIGFPAVMKVVSPDILHKSERGGVIVDIQDEAGARAAFETIRDRAAGADFRGVIIYPLIRGSQELLVGLSRDPQFGPVIVFGLGGIYTEVLRDIALRVAPIDRAEADAMIRSLRSFPILAGARGQRPCDLSALADLLVKVSQLPFRYPEIAEIDLNPVFAGPEGAIVGDVRVICKA